MAKGEIATTNEFVTFCSINLSKESLGVILIIPRGLIKWITYFKAVLSFLELPLCELILKFLRITLICDYLVFSYLSYSVIASFYDLPLFKKYSTVLQHHYY